MADPSWWGQEWGLSALPSKCPQPLFPSGWKGLLSQGLSCSSLGQALWLQSDLGHSQPFFWPIPPPASKHFSHDELREQTLGFRRHFSVPGRKRKATCRWSTVVGGQGVHPAWGCAASAFRFSH